MPDSEWKHRQTGQYDKLIRENLEVTLPVFIRDVLKIDMALYEELPDDIQHTKERKPDALKKVTTTGGEAFVIHIEFQTEDEPEMPFRMGEYYIMLLRKYKLPVRQYVIYLRDKRPTMSAFIETDRLKFSYDILLVSEMNYRLFLNSPNPEVKMLAILADFANTDGYSVVKEVIDEIHEHTKADFAESRFFKQMRIFVQLRSSIQPQFERVMQTVSKFFREEKDFLYRRGAEKERAKAQEEKRNIARAMRADGLSVAKISQFTGLSTEEIQSL